MSLITTFVPITMEFIKRQERVWCIIAKTIGTTKITSSVQEMEEQYCSAVNIKYRNKDCFAFM